MGLKIKTLTDRAGSGARDLETRVEPGRGRQPGNLAGQAGENLTREWTRGFFIVEPRADPRALETPAKISRVIVFWSNACVGVRHSERVRDQ